ncbi:MAG: hypothetical protein P8J14_08160 [Emcibacteraceae bacterium]|nr:hypothetical protein [Emcibacteraceae bacterium]
MNKSFTRREFAIGTTGAVGAVAAASMQANAAEKRTSETYAPFDVPKGTKQFTNENIINNDAVRMDMPLGVINGVNDGPTLIVTGGLFATEYSGVEAASRLYRDTDPAKLSGRLIVIPVITMELFNSVPLCLA